MTPSTRSDLGLPVDGFDPSVAVAKAYQFHGAVNALFSILQDAGRDFGQDYKAWVVFSAFLVAAAADTLRDAAALRCAPGYAPGVLSAQSLSEMTGIPRETVRRKCQALVARGLLTVDEGGLFRLDVDSDTVDNLSERFGRINPVALVVDSAGYAAEYRNR